MFRPNTITVCGTSPVGVILRPLVRYTLLTSRRWDFPPEHTLKYLVTSPTWTGVDEWGSASYSPSEGNVRFLTQ